MFGLNRKRNLRELLIKRKGSRTGLHLHISSHTSGSSRPPFIPQFSAAFIGSFRLIILYFVSHEQVRKIVKWSGEFSFIFHYFIGKECFIFYNYEVLQYLRCFPLIFPYNSSWSPFTVFSSDFSIWFNVKSFYSVLLWFFPYNLSWHVFDFKFLDQILNTRLLNWIRPIRKRRIMAHFLLSSLNLSLLPFVMIFHLQDSGKV